MLEEHLPLGTGALLVVSIHLLFPKEVQLGFMMILDFGKLQERELKFLLIKMAVCLVELQT